MYENFQLESACIFVYIRTQQHICVAGSSSFAIFWPKTHYALFATILFGNFLTSFVGLSEKQNYAASAVRRIYSEFWMLFDFFVGSLDI